MHATFYPKSKIDHNASHTNVANNTLVIRVVSAVCCQVKGHRQAFLTRREILLVETIRLLCSAEARVLTDGPRLVGVHGGEGTPLEGVHSGSLL